MARIRNRRGNGSRKKTGQCVSQSGRILGDLARLLRLFGNEAIQELERPLRIGQGGQQRRHSASRSRREAFEMTKFRARTNRVAELDLFEEIQHCSDYRVTYANAE